MLIFIYSGLVSGIRRDGNFSTVNDDALSKVVEKWLGRTIRKHRTWQTLLGVAEKFDDHEMLKFLKKNHITSNIIVLTKFILHTH